MKCIINAYQKNELSGLNGLTFNVVGHCNGFLEVDTGDIIVDFELSEVLIVDIETEIRHAIFRDNKTFCDYWYRILKLYCKENKIKLPTDKNTNKITAGNVAPVDELPEFSEISDSDIFN